MFVVTKQEKVFEAKLVLFMHLDTNFRSGSGAATKWPETIENMSFRPKVVDCVCLLQKNKKWFLRHKLMH